MKAQTQAQMRDRMIRETEEFLSARLAPPTGPERCKEGLAQSRRRSAAREVVAANPLEQADRGPDASQRRFGSTLAGSTSRPYRFIFL